MYQTLKSQVPDGFGVMDDTDEVYACGYCEKEFSRVDALSAHADACDQSGLLAESEEDEDKNVQSNITDICKTFFKEEQEPDEDEPSAVTKASRGVKIGGCSRCGKTGFANKQLRSGHEKRCSGIFVRQPKFSAWKSNGAYLCKEPKCTAKTPFQTEYR